MTVPLSAWARRRERGSVLLLRFMVWLCLRVSTFLGRVLLWPIALWFTLTAPAARAASRAWLTRATGRPVGMRDVVLHIHAFACAIMDRVFFLAGRTDRHRSEVEGLHHLLAHIEAGRGCILLGAHLGSFDALRALGRAAPVPVRPAMFRANTGAQTALLEQLDPDLAARIIDLGRPEAMLRVREAVGRGELVAFLADRATDPRRLEPLMFFGEPAPFPTGPFRIALMLKAPVVMFLGIRLGPRHYSLRFDPLPEPDTADRKAALLQIMTAYVSRLEAACRLYPLQWFNFYDFWRSEARSADPRAATGQEVTAPIPPPARPRLFSSAPLPSAALSSTVRPGDTPFPGPRPPWTSVVLRGLPCKWKRSFAQNRGKPSFSSHEEVAGLAGGELRGEVSRTARRARTSPPPLVTGVVKAKGFTTETTENHGGPRSRRTTARRLFILLLMTPLLMPLLAPGAAQTAEQQGGLVESIARLLGARPAHQARFREEKTLPRLTRPLVSTGVLSWTPPDRLEKRTLAPVPESFVIEGHRATITGADNAPHTLDVDAHVELRVLTTALIGILSGDLTVLRREFEVTAEGAPASWRLTLTPRGADAATVLRTALVTGDQGSVREIRLLLSDGNWSVLTVDGG